jgi:hypothetical protein
VGVLFTSYHINNFMIRLFNEVEELEDHYQYTIEPMSINYYMENELTLGNFYNPSKSLDNILLFWESMVEFEADIRDFY